MANSKNSLASETSPYLLQHAANPVQWYPWDAPALSRARDEDKPILLSIGYSACHWCHVMAHESFEDPATAELMNRLFVNIKVDREERPDLDRIYQLAHQMLVQRPGGWPLTMFLTPDDRTPFFGGTYFPPEPRHGLPGFRTLLERVAHYYAEHKQEISDQGNAIRDVFSRLEANAPEGGRPPDATPLAGARQHLEHAFDAQWGGFGQAPRFPNAAAIERLLRHWRTGADGENADVQALFMATLTLRRMAEGGINDQLAGGFCRYSVDDYWMIPHFEKMLYDNAALLPVYSWAAQSVGESLFRETAELTAAWMLRVMQDSEGGFYASLDADSEGHEGKYYVWDQAQISAVLDENERAVFAMRFGLDRPANFEGQWHLHVFADLDSIAAQLGKTETEVAALLRSARKKLFEARARRVRPALDDKILTAWNGLAIMGLASAAVALQRMDLADAATRAVDFLRAHCWHGGRLLASWRKQRARHVAYLDDYAFLGMGLLRLTEARWRTQDLDFAIEIAEALLGHFEDQQAGGFFFTADDHEQLIHRPKPMSDDATPSGNAVATQFLNRLGHLLGEGRYLLAAERALAAAHPALEQQPSAHCTFINALEEFLAPLEVVVIRGEAPEIDAWRLAAQSLYAPNRMVIAVPANAKNLPGALALRKARDSAVAYRCVGTHCSPAITSTEQLLGELGLQQIKKATENAL